MTFKEAEELYAEARNKSGGKPLDNNTRLHKRTVKKVTEYDQYAIQLHGTDVVTMSLSRDGTTDYTIDSGEWHTVTTKQRINKYVPNIRLYTVKGIMKVAYGWDGTSYMGEALFKDGMVFNHEGIYQL
tara:strand:+ start:773 stop:1156 length:384 start_codon:yes stop_codon:yes gene_type:complete